MIQQTTQETDCLTLQFGGRELRISTGNHVKAEEIDVRGRPHGILPKGRLIEPVAFDSSGGDPKYRSTADWGLPADRSWAQIFANVPSDLLGIVARFSSHQWPMLESANNHPPFLDLLRSNPILAYALACNDELRRTTPEFAARKAEGRAKCKQRDIAKFLGFPATEATVRLLRRVMPEAVNPSTLRLLRAAMPLDGETFKMLSHVDAINAGALVFVVHASLRGLLTPNLLGELLACEEEMIKAPTADTLLDTLRMGHGIRGWAGLPALHSRRQVRALHDRTLLEHLADRERVRQEQAVWREYQRELARHEQEERVRRTAPKKCHPREVVFPAPPVPGTNYIVPVISEADLILEGVTQRNCAASYASEVLAGDIYIYRVLEPQRATLSLVPGDKGLWFLKEMKLKANRKASKQLFAIVHKWLAAQPKRSEQVREWDDTPF